MFPRIKNRYEKEMVSDNKEKFVYRHFLEKYNIELNSSEIQECITISETYNYTFEMIDFLIDACPKVRANDFDILREIIFIFYRSEIKTINQLKELLQ